MTVPVQPQTPNTQPDPGAVVNALEGLFSTHEARVLGAVSLFVGYLCIFFTKIMSFTEIYIGVLGVAVLIILLLSLNRDINWRSLEVWLRAVVVVAIGILLTAPQLHFAWTVSVSEARLAAEADQSRRAAAARDAFVPPKVNIEQPRR